MCLSDTHPEIGNGQIGMEVGSVMGDAGQAYTAAFVKQYGAAPRVSYAGYAYDGVKLMAAAIEKAGSADPAAVRKALEATGQNYVGATGTISFDQDGQRLDPPYTKLKFADGKMQVR